MPPRPHENSLRERADFDARGRVLQMDVFRYFDETSIHVMQARRNYLSALIRSQCDSVTQYGILKGFRVPPSRWAELVSSSYILGTYEVAVCAILDALKEPNKTVVDLGGADGVFGAGLVEVGAFGSSIIFEMDAERRQAIMDLVQARGLNDKVAVRGEARSDFPDLLAAQGRSLRNCVILCDIEGGEFSLFQDELLARLSEAHVIIELHDFFLADAAVRETAIGNLKRIAERHFHVCEIKDGLRDIRNIPLLRNWSDWDSYLLCVEARYRMMSWLWLRPKHEGALSPVEVDTLILDYQRRIFAE